MTIAGAQLNGVASQFTRLTLPYYGRWHADVRLMGGSSDLGGAQALTVAGVTYNCAVFRARDEAGTLSARLVGGTGGLANTVPAKAYQSSAGILLSVVLSDLMADCGEKITLDGGDKTIGNAYVRMEMPAARVLNDLLGTDGWWMDPAGTIHTGPRDLSPIGTEYMATRWRGASGVYVIVPNVPADWTPGRTFSNTSVSGTVSRVEHDISAKELKTTVMVGEQGTDRLKDPLDSVIEEAQAALLYYLTWPYTVNTVDAGPPVTMQLLSNDSRAPNLQRVVLWPGPSGAWSTPPVGATVRVRFVAADPTQPEVYGLDPANPPTSVTIAGGGPAVGRVGDAVALDSPGPAEILGSVSGTECTITAAQFAAAMPIINAGSTKVTSG